MFSNSFIFNVSRETYETHRKYGFCATGNSSEPIDSLESLLDGTIPYKHYGILSNILNVRDEDIIFFYLEGEGFKGIYRAKESPFFDATALESVPASRPFRIKIECLHHFDQAVPENALFANLERQGIFWLWYHNKIRRTGRGCTPLDPDARDTLIELLIRYNNGKEAEKAFHPAPYPNSYNISELRSFRVLHDANSGSINYEGALEAMMMSAFREKRSTVSHIFGDFANLEWFANQIPYHVSGKTIDMMLYHRSKEFLGIDSRYKISILELKRGVASIDTMKQLLTYCEWAADHLAKGDSHLIQPVIVAYDFDDSALSLLHSDYFSINPTFKKPQMIRYRYNLGSGLRLENVLNPVSSGDTLDEARYIKIKTKLLKQRGEQKEPFTSPAQGIEA